MLSQQGVFDLQTDELRPAAEARREVRLDDFPSGIAWIEVAAELAVFFTLEPSRAWRSGASPGGTLAGRPPDTCVNAGSSVAVLRPGMWTISRHDRIFEAV